MRKIGLCVDDMIGLQELFSVLINFTDLNFVFREGDNIRVIRVMLISKNR